MFSILMLTKLNNKQIFEWIRLIVDFILQIKIFIIFLVIIMFVEYDFCWLTENGDDAIIFYRLNLCFFKLFYCSLCFLFLYVLLYYCNGVILGLLRLNKLKN